MSTQPDEAGNPRPDGQSGYRLMVREGLGLGGDARDDRVLPDAERLSYPVRGRWGWRAYRDIATVTLQTNYVARIGTIAQCIIGFRDGTMLRIHSSDPSGRPDEARAADYRAFVDDFHRRLVAGDFDRRISFRTGFSRGRYGILVGATIAAALLFIVLPIGLALATGSVGILYAPIFGLVLVWPAWQIAQRNAPGGYDPKSPPDLLKAGPVRTLF